MDIPAMIAAGQHPIVILLLKNKSVVAAKEEYGLSWLYTGRISNCMLSCLYDWLFSLPSYYVN